MKTKTTFKFLLVISFLLLQFNLQAVTIHVETAGTLPTLIEGSQKYEITKLTLTGDLNGTDIRYIREMAGRWVDYIDFKPMGKLTILDLSEANIVSGGDSYSDFAYINYFTSDNEIGNSFFYGCTLLTSVILPQSVKSIGREAFSGCSSLTSITIPDSITSIEFMTFAGCSSLTLIMIPESVTSIGMYAFSGCTSLTSVTIPNSVTSIGGSSFYGCTSLTSIAIPNSVTSIESRSFESCSGLISITIPESITSIGGLSFYGCTSLTSIAIPNSVTSIESRSFEGCSGLISVTIPESVTSINFGVFYGCTSLISVTIPESVTSIQAEAFAGCSSLTSINIPDIMNFIGFNAFFDCTGLKEFIVSEQNAQYSVIDGVLCNKNKTTLISYPNSKAKTYTIPESVTTIGEYAFYDCIDLTAITIPNNVISIGEYAFYGCIGLTSVTIPNSVTTIEAYTFYNCVSLNSVIIGNQVLDIKFYAFYGCTGLKEVHCKNPKPSTILYAGSFGNSKMTTCILYYPKGSYDYYLVYRLFFVYLIEEDITSINPISKDNISIHSLSNGISIETKETTPISIYNMSGQKIYQSGINGITEINLNKGIYIVQSNNQSQKVLVK